MALKNGPCKVVFPGSQWKGYQPYPFRGRSCPIQKAVGKMSFLSCWWDMLVPWRVCLIDAATQPQQASSFEALFFLFFFGDCMIVFLEARFKV